MRVNLWPCRKLSNFHINIHDRHGVTGKTVLRAGIEVGIRARTVLASLADDGWSKQHASQKTSFLGQKTCFMPDSPHGRSHGSH